MPLITGRKLIVVADLVGTGVFAVQGAVVAVVAGLDWLGVLVMAFVTALGGGMARDVLLGEAPPAALQDGRYSFVVLAATAFILATSGHAPGFGGEVLLTLDAAGLALFTVAGTEKALNAECRAFAAAGFGALTATGGGVLRDVLLAQVPAILRVDFYATAALAGAVTIIFLRRAGLPARVAGLGGAGVCFVLRMAGALLGWHLPRTGG